MTWPQWLAWLKALAGAKPPPPPTKPPPTPTPAPTPTPPVDYRAQLVTLHNAFRSSHGLAPLVYHPSLESSAQRFASDLAAHPEILTSANPHVGSDGSTVGQRIYDAGYKWSYAGENAAEGATATQVEAMWENHGPHAANILGPYKNLGVGRAGSMWVVDFGSPL